MADVFGTETSPDNLTEEERMRRFFAGTAPSRPNPVPPQPTTIDRPGDVTPGIGRARAEVAATPPDLGPSTPVAPSNPPSAGLKPPQPITPAEQMREQGPPKLGGWKKGLDIAGQIISPYIEQRIPGSTGNYYAKLGQAEREESRQLGMKKTEADIANTEAETALRGRMPVEKPEPVQKPENLQQVYADAVTDAQNRG